MRKIASPQITAGVIFQPEFPVFSTKWWVPVTLTLPSFSSPEPVVSWSRGRETSVTN